MVFVSYSRHDARWRDWFLGMLAPSVRARRLEMWSDQRELVGEGWRPQLADAIARSRVALLLVSREFLASEFIMTQELPALIERGARLFCVLVGPCLYDEVAELERVQWAHNPKLDGPPAQKQRREAWIVRVCMRLLELLPASDQDAEESADEHVAVGGRSLARAERLGGGARLGELRNVPSLPSAFVAREELAGLREAVLRTADGAVGVTGKPLGFQGEGGIGKTVLAAALAHDPEVRRHFPDGVFWVTIGASGDLVSAQLELLSRLG